MKVKLTVTIDEELFQFLKKYAKENYTTMSAVINQYLAKLQREENILKKELDKKSNA